MKEICSIYNSPFGMLTIVNDGYYVTKVLYGNYSDSFLFEQHNSLNKKVMEELLEYFDGKRQTFDIPLNFNGTKFQNKVWNALLKIPYGKTRSYSEIAEDIGKPTSIRAIGNATARNPIAILIPSHRVVTANGMLSGYNGGIFNKKKLLDLEKSVINKNNQRLAIKDSVSNELISKVLLDTDICEFYYYPQEDIFIMSQRTCEKFGFKSKYEDGLQDLINENIMINDRKVFFDGIKRSKIGETPVKFEVRFANGLWSKCTLSIIKYDESQKPLIVVGIYQDITHQKHLEMENDRLIRLNKDMLFPLNEIFFGIYKLDLITGKLYSVSLINDVIEFKSDFSYIFDEWIRTNNNNYYHFDDSNKTMSNITLKSLIIERDNGTKFLEWKHKHLLDGSYHLFSNNIIMNNEYFSKDIAIIYQIDISRYYKHLNVFEDICNDYDTLYLINLIENTYEPIRCDSIVKNELKIQSIGNYQDMVNLYVERFVYETEKSVISNFMSLDNLRNVLTKKCNTISKIFRKRFGLHYEWVEIKFTLNAMYSNHVVILSIKNVNQDIKYELEIKQLLETVLYQTMDLSRNKSDFLIRISKEINPSITTLTGYTTLAKNSIDNPEKLKNYLEKVSFYNNELLSMMNNVLNSGKVDFEDHNMNNKEFNISNLIQYVFEILMSNVESNSIDFNYHIENVIHENLIGDIDKISLILMSVLNNAIKYTSKGGSIDLVIKEMSIPYKNESYYQFIIKGSDIDSLRNKLDNILNKGINNSNLDLGLVATINIIDCLYGDISLESERNQETKIIINLPVQYANNKSIIEQIDFMCRVLVVNSNECELSYICSILNDLNIFNTSLSFGKYVINEILNAHSKSKDYSVVVIDEKLIDMNYLTLIQNIYDVLGVNHIKVVVTTFNYELIQANCHDKKVDLIFPKPVFKQSIINSLIKIPQTFRQCFLENPIKSKPLKGYNCLLVEHNLDIHLIAVELVSLLGTHITVAKNGQEALEIFNKNPNHFDFITMDIDMPNFDGFKATKKIRKVDKGIPIIAMSSNSFSEDIPNCISNGFNFHIAKPIDDNLSFFAYIILTSIEKYRYLRDGTSN